MPAPVHSSAALTHRPSRSNDDMSAPRDATHDDDVEIIGPWRPKPRHAEVVASRASAASSESHTCSSMPRTSSARHATPATGTTSASAAAAASSVSAASAAAASVSVSAASAAPSDLDFGSFRSSDVAVALRDVFGHRTLRAPQARAVSCALRSKDCFVLAPTGGGKSLCYQLPAVLHARQEPGTVTIVVSPLIALMQDQVAHLLSRGVYAAMLGSSMSVSDKRVIYADLDRLGSEPDNLPANETKDFDPRPTTPGRRIAVLFMSPELLCAERGREILAHLVKQKRIKLIAIDEAHCISSWGHQFRSSFLKLSFIKSAYPSLPLMLLTATATRQVQSDVLKALHLDPASVEFIRQSFNRPNIYYSVCHKETIKTIEGEDMTIYKHMKQFIDKCAALLPNNNTANATNDSAATVPKPLAPIFTAAARSSAPPRQAGGARPSTPSTPRSATPSAPICTGIIYCGSRDACDLVASELRKLKITAASYHAGLSAKDRSQVQESWMKNQIQVIVATIAFGMGIDKADVRFVIHYQLSSSMEAYYQESGRCGRDGLPSNALMYYSQDDLRRGQWLCKQEDDKSSALGAGSVEHRLALLEAMMKFCEATECRRKRILAYFSEALDVKSAAVIQTRAEGRCCDACSDAERVKQSLSLAKTIGSVRYSGAGMSGMKSGFVYCGPRHGDEYESGEEHQLTALQQERRRADDAESRIVVPKHILLDKAEGFGKLMDLMQAQEKRAMRKEGVETRVVRTPFKQEPAKRARVAYHGPVLGVNGTHVIADLAVARREDCYKKIVPAIKTNREFVDAAAATAATPPATPHSVASVGAALEYLSFIQSRTSAIYLMKIRTLLSNVSMANRNKTPFADANTIDWNTIPTETNEDDDESDEDASVESDDSDSEGEHKKVKSEFTKASTKLPTGGGFQSASSLVGQKSVTSRAPAFGSKGSSVSAATPSANTFFGAPHVKPPLSTFVAASKVQMASSHGPERSPMKGLRARATSTPGASASEVAIHTKPDGHHAFGSKAAASSAHATQPHAAVARTTLVSPLHRATASTPSTLAASLPSIAAHSASKSTTPPRYKIGGTLALSWAHPTAAAKQHAAALAAHAATNGAATSTTVAATAAAHSSPARIRPLAITTAPRTPPISGEKRARTTLNLTPVSAEKRQRVEAPTLPKTQA